MTYRVIRKKYLESQKQIAIVEEFIEADNMVVQDGALVFTRGHGTGIMAIPSGAWLDSEAGIPEPALVTP